MHCDFLSLLFFSFIFLSGFSFSFVFDGGTNTIDGLAGRMDWLVGPFFNHHLSSLLVLLDGNGGVRIFKGKKGSQSINKPISARPPSETKMLLFKSELLFRYLNRVFSPARSACFGFMVLFMFEYLERRGGLVRRKEIAEAGVGVGVGVRVALNGIDLVDLLLCHNMNHCVLGVM